VHASVPGPHSTPATPVGALVGTDETPPTPDGGVPVVGGALVLVDALVLVVVVHMSGSSTDAVTVLVNSSGHVATTVIVIVPVTPPGTTVVAFVLAPPGTGFVTMETSYVTPDTSALAVTAISLRGSPFVIVHVTRCEPSEHDATPVTGTVCAPAGAAIASAAATIARQVKDFTILIRPLLPWSLEAASVTARFPAHAIDNDAGTRASGCRPPDADQTTAASDAYSTMSGIVRSLVTGAIGMNIQ
jgi:hypothetical protein